MEKVKPENVVELLKKHRVHISLEQAGLILDFMYKLARITFTKNEKT